MSEEHHGPGLTGRAARFGLSAVFIRSGVELIRNPGGRAAKAEAAGIPQPELATRLNGAAMLAAGTTLALGIRPRQSAAALLLLLVPTTLVGHPFWKEEGPNRAMQETHFLKNVGLAGGLLAAIAAER
jgi:uncharacterized membrane protein YphA (DoxX/SURF4 family)